MAARPPTTPTHGRGPDHGGGRRRGSGIRLLTSAIAGGSVVAGHALVGLTGTHVENLALQAFSIPTEQPGSDRTAGADGARLTPSVPPASESGPRLEALASTPPVDVASIVGGATSAVRDVAREREDADQGARDSAGSTAPAGNGASSCAAGTSGFGSVADSVAAAGEQLRCRFSIETVFGVAGRSNASDHPAGKALDFMAERTNGDQLAEYTAANMDRLGISYVIYRQRINTGDGWEPMDDRGGVTANHMDHVHVSFD